MLKAQGVPALDDNYIWLIRREGKPQMAIVDPTEAAPVLAVIESEGLEPVAILITHHHWDHVGGIEELVSRFPMPVYGPARETIPHLSHPVDEGDEVVLETLDARFRVMDVSGHTAGHIAYVGHGMLFCGDTLFAGGCGRVFEGTPAQMQLAMSRIRALPDDTRVYCAHEYTEANLRFARVAEPENAALAQRQQDTAALRAKRQPTVPSLLGLEKATNPFLRYDEPSLIKAAEGFTGHALSTDAEVFAAVRHWKDTLD
jgi:hydroxyacylglutathione hydrolase